MEVDQPLIQAIHERKPIDYENKIDKLNNTIDNLQSLINALSFYHLPAIQSKEIHEGKTQTVSDQAITSQIEGAESQKEQFSISILSPKKRRVIYDYDSDSKLNTYKECSKNTSIQSQVF